MCVSISSTLYKESTLIFQIKLMLIMCYGNKENIEKMKKKKRKEERNVEMNSGGWILIYIV